MQSRFLQRKDGPVERVGHAGAISALAGGVAIMGLFAIVSSGHAQAQDKRPNIVMLMTDDTGWNDFGAIRRRHGARPSDAERRSHRQGRRDFTNWYGQASCTAGRASFITGRIPIRSALSIVVAPGDENYLRKETPTIAEFFQKNGYSTYFSGKWHLGDKPDSYPIEHGFDEMKHFAAYYAGVYAYNDTVEMFHPWFPSYNPEFKKMYDDIVNLGEWEGVAGQPAKKVGTITYDSLATFDIRQTDSAVAYIKEHAKSDKPFFMDVNFIKMHNPTNAAPEFRGQVASRRLLGFPDGARCRYRPHHGCHSRRGAQHDRHRDGRQRRLAGCLSRRRHHAVPRREGHGLRRRLARPGIMWWPGHIPAGARYDEMMSHIDCWATLAAMVGLDAAAPRLGRQRRQADLLRQHRQQRLHPGQGPALGADVVDLHRWRDVQGRSRRHRRRSERALGEYRVEVSLHGEGLLARPGANLGAIGALYNLTMDPLREIRHDLQRGRADARDDAARPGKYAGEDNGWVLALISPVIVDFDKSIMKYPSIKRFPGGASTDLTPNLQHPENPVPLLKDQGAQPQPVGGGGG